MTEDEKQEAKRLQNEWLNKEYDLIEQVEFLECQVGFWKFIAGVSIAGIILVGILMLVGNWPWRV